jgi:hypothetical protein
VLLFSTPKYFEFQKNTGFHVVAQNHPDVGLVLKNLIDLHIHVHSFTVFEPHALGDPGVQCIVVVVSQTGCVTEPPFFVFRGQENT